MSGAPARDRARTPMKSSNDNVSATVTMRCATANIDQCDKSQLPFRQKVALVKN
jgi:hypothetical protein